MTRPSAVIEGYAIQSILEQVQGAFPKDVIKEARREVESMQRRIINLKITNEKLTDRLHQAWETNNFLQNARDK